MKWDFCQSDSLMWNAPGSRSLRVTQPMMDTDLAAWGTSGLIGFLPPTIWQSWQVNISCLLNCLSDSQSCETSPAYGVPAPPCHPWEEIAGWRLYTYYGGVVTLVIAGALIAKLLSLHNLPNHLYLKVLESTRKYLKVPENTWKYQKVPEST